MILLNTSEPADSLAATVELPGREREGVKGISREAASLIQPSICHLSNTEARVDSAKCTQDALLSIGQLQRVIFFILCFRVKI